MCRNQRICSVLGAIETAGLGAYLLIMATFAPIGRFAAFPGPLRDGHVAPLGIVPLEPMDGADRDE
jgi:hypothetical protein